MSAYNYDNYKETEAGYPMKCSGDGFGEYRYIKTYCGNMWYSINPNPMRRDGCICPNCGRTIKIFMPEKLEKKGE